MTKVSLHQLRALWEALGWPQRLGVVGASLASLTLFIILATGSTGDEYCKLCADIDDRASVVAIADDLEKAGIPYKIGSGGRAIEVKRCDLARSLTLVVQSTPRHSRAKESPAGIFAGPLITTPRNRRASETRRREEELQHTISLYRSVRRARVLITPADNRLFSRKQKMARASVFLQLLPGKTLSRGQVQAIRDLVGNSVQGLRRDAIAFADSNGTDYAKLLSAHKVARGKDELELQDRVEGLLAQKIRNHLEVMFGRKNVNVAVSALVSLDSAKTGRSARARRSGAVKLVSLSVTAAAGSRQMSRRGGRARGSVLDSVTSLSVAVFVDSKLFPGGAIPERLRAAVAENIRTVSRLDEKRGDRLSIQAVPFRGVREESVDSTATVALATVGTYSYLSYWSFGGGLFLLLLTLLVLLVNRRRARTRRMEADATAMSGVFNVSVQNSPTCSSRDWSDPASREHLVRGAAQRDPEVIARLIRTIRLDRDEESEY